MRSARIKDGVVVNVELATPGGDLVAIPDGSSVGIGWTWDGATFTPPDPKPVVAPVMTTLDFLRLFTPAEVIKWNAAKAGVAAMTANDYADPANAALAQFSYFLALFLETNTIDVSRSDLKAGLDTLVALGIIAPERKAAVIAGKAP